MGDLIIFLLGQSGPIFRGNVCLFQGGQSCFELSYLEASLFVFLDHGSFMAVNFSIFFSKHLATSTMDSKGNVDHQMFETICTSHILLLQKNKFKLKQAPIACTYIFAISTVMYSTCSLFKQSTSRSNETIQNKKKHAFFDHRIYCKRVEAHRLLLNDLGCFG